MKMAWRDEIPSLILIGAWFLAVAIYFPQAPDRLPTHMGFNGEVDGYGGKFEGLIAAPLTCLAVFMLFVAVQRWDKSCQTDPRRARQVSILRFATVFALLTTYLVVMIRGLYPDLDVPNLLSGIIGAFYILVGNYLGKFRPNGSFGVRTPWTIKSKLSWVGSNRICGWMMVALGAALILVSAFWPRFGGVVFFLGSGALTIGVLTYSYYLYRIDPDPISPFSTNSARRD